jgi:hypothetical protein
MDRFVPRDDGSTVTACKVRQSMDCFVPRNDIGQLLLAWQWPLFCHGEERSDAAIHVSFTKLYRLDVP